MSSIKRLIVELRCSIHIAWCALRGKVPPQHEPECGTKHRVFWDAS